MLVLTRKRHEAIVINKDITLTVLEVRGDKVRIGIDAPPGVQIHREEVWLKLQEERKCPQSPQ